MPHGVTTRRTSFVGERIGCGNGVSDCQIRRRTTNVSRLLRDAHLLLISTLCCSGVRTYLVSLY